MVSPSNQARNRLLSALPQEAVASLRTTEERVSFARVLFEFGENAKEAFFPDQGTVVSLVRTSMDGGEVEVGIVGGDGFTEIQSFLAPSSYRARGVVQGEGVVTRVSLAALRDLAASDQTARELLLAYVAAHMEQVAQNALCNGIHTIQQRLSKWLLIMRDRVGSDTLHLTHEFLAQMLGIRRSGVTVAVGTLTDAGLIEHARNRIVLLKPSAIEKRACDCYTTIAAVLESFNAQLENPRSSKSDRDRGRSAR
jgi:CRP-like cAMP-binding protein